MRKRGLNFQQVVAAAPDDYVSQYELGIADEHLGPGRKLKSIWKRPAAGSGSRQCRKELEMSGENCRQELIGWRTRSVLETCRVKN